MCDGTNKIEVVDHISIQNKVRLLTLLFVMFCFVGESVIREEFHPRLDAVARLTLTVVPNLKIKYILLDGVAVQYHWILAESVLYLGEFVGRAKYKQDESNVQ